MSLVLIPGSFDPMTRGHAEMIRKTAGIFDEVVVGMLLPLGGKDDRGLDDHTANVVGHPRDGTLDDGRMGHQGTLHLKGTDAIA